VFCYSHAQEETPFEKRAREQLDRHRLKEQEKAVTAIKRAAQATIAKITPALDAVSVVLGKEEMSLVAEPLREPLLTSQSIFREWVSACTHNLEVEDEARANEIPDNKVVAVQIAASKKAIGLVCNMLSAISRSRVLSG